MAWIPVAMRSKRNINYSTRKDKTRSVELTAGIKMVDPVYTAISCAGISNGCSINQNLILDNAISYVYGI